MQTLGKPLQKVKNKQKHIKERKWKNGILWNTELKPQKSRKIIETKKANKKKHNNEYDRY